MPLRTPHWQTGERGEPQVLETKSQQNEQGFYPGLMAWIRMYILLFMATKRDNCHVLWQSIMETLMMEMIDLVSPRRVFLIEQTQPSTHTSQIKSENIKEGGFCCHPENIAPSLIWLEPAELTTVGFPRMFRPKPWRPTGGWGGVRTMMITAGTMGTQHHQHDPKRCSVFIWNKRGQNTSWV